MNIVLTQKEKRLTIIVVVVFAVTVLGTGFARTQAIDYVQKQTSLKQSLESEVVDIRTRLAGIEDEREAVRANRENYLRWVNSGVVGEQKEDRVNWIKAMKQVTLEKNLFPSAYSFPGDAVLLSPDASPFTQGSNVQIRLWSMNLNMPMLHDLDALLFLETLESRVSSLFFPIECSFALNQPEFSLEKRENMSSSCRLVWVSANDPESKIVGQ